jgi:hypothetical protein
MGIVASTLARKCVYCGNPIRQDARGCRACNRWQPKKKTSADGFSPFLLPTVLIAILVVSSMLFVRKFAHSETPVTSIDAIKTAEQLAASCHSNLDKTVIDAILTAFHDDGDSWQKAVEVSASIACSSGGGISPKTRSSGSRIPAHPGSP